MVVADDVLLSMLPPFLNICGRALSLQLLIILQVLQHSVHELIEHIIAGSLTF